MHQGWEKKNWGGTSVKVLDTATAKTKTQINKTAYVRGKEVYWKGKCWVKEGKEMVIEAT